MLRIAFVPNASGLHVTIGAKTLSTMPLRPLTRPPRPQAAIPDGFDSTEWSLVLNAGAAGGVALDRLCRTYWRPVYVYMRASGLPRAEAEDATQEFFADMLRRDWLKLADRERGSFRAFLRHSARLFLNNRRRIGQAQRRGGGTHPVSLDTAACELELARAAVLEADPAVRYEQAWADCVLQAAVARLAAEHETAEKRARFERLRPFLTSPPVAGDYERIARELDCTSGQVAVAVHRLTRRLGEMIRAEIASTLADPNELEAELRHLLRLVAGAN